VRHSRYRSSGGVRCVGSPREWDAAEGFIDRDSAGVRIIENLAPAWSEANAWAVADQPRLVIGHTMGAADYELYGVQLRIA
jgi:hypothetical protein